jgi:putative membrane protein
MAHRWELSPVLLAKGAVIGVANIIPGVSGGTIAVVLGLYDRLVESISSLTNPSRASLATIFPFSPSSPSGACPFLPPRHDYLYTEHMHPTALFHGLIIGSVPTNIGTYDMRPLLQT